jgi:hypothetical protein
MTIQAIEDHTLVETPTGHYGRVRVTRRERKLIDEGKKDSIVVMGTDGLRRQYPLDDLVIVDEYAEEEEGGVI